MPLSDYSIARLVYMTVLPLIVAGVCAYFLNRSDRESTRLLNLTKNYYKDRKFDDAKELKKIKTRMIIGYSLFLIVNIAVAFFFGMALWGRL